MVEDSKWQPSIRINPKLNITHSWLAKRQGLDSLADWIWTWVEEGQAQFLFDQIHSTEYLEADAPTQRLIWLIPCTGKWDPWHGALKGFHLPLDIRREGLKETLPDDFQTFHLRFDGKSRSWKTGNPKTLLQMRIHWKSDHPSWSRWDAWVRKCSWLDSSPSSSQSYARRVDWVGQIGLGASVSSPLGQLHSHCSNLDWNWPESRKGRNHLARRWVEKRLTSTKTGRQYLSTIMSNPIRKNLLALEAWWKLV